MNLRILCVLTAVVMGLSGCLHGRGIHEIPVERDYKSLEKVSVDDASPVLHEAHRKGAHRYAPYEYDSAKTYYKYGVGARDEGDRKGHKDYAALAKRYAEQALANGSGIADEGDLPMPDTAEQAAAELERIKAMFRSIDPCKARIVAPHVYAEAETNLAQAEHELNERCHYPEAIRHLREVEPDLRAIMAHDIDLDGVVDLDDGEPWIAEDPDGFQDEDGMPEPKPYPALDDVNFAVDSAALSADAKGYLRGVAHMLLDGYKEAKLYLRAHTDSDASDAYNQGLSQRREAAVRDYLLTQGVNAQQVVGSAAGESEPKVPNTSASAKAANRRVELTLDSPDPVSPFCQN